MRLVKLSTLILLLTMSVNAETKKFEPAKSYNTTPESEPPRYVSQFNDWIDLGLQYRLRVENRANDFQRTIDATNTPILSRTRVYLGIKNRLDPVRFTIEFQDSRIANSQFPYNNLEVNKLAFIQAYGELYFPAISLRAGRMAFEVLDRRLIARNEWRNTSNNFQGFRTLIGKKEGSWQLDAFALQPVIRLTDEVDQPNLDQWFYGGILSWRQSESVAIQPFYFQLNQTQTSSQMKREIYSPGLRAHGKVENSHVDYDVIGVYQFGENGTQQHRAYGYVAEAGYSFNQKWQPRLSLNYGYGHQHFERLFGFSRPWSSNDYVRWENIKALKTRLELKINTRLQLDSSVSAYWLASKTDAWTSANLRDSKGNSGDVIGYELDARALYKLTPNLLANTGYTYFVPGEFTQNVGRDTPSHFLYLELTWNL